MGYYISRMLLDNSEEAELLPDVYLKDENRLIGRLSFFIREGDSPAT